MMLMILFAFYYLQAAIDSDVKINVLEVDISYDPPLINTAEAIGMFMFYLVLIVIIDLSSISEFSIAEEEDKVTYTELKTVDTVELVKTIPEVAPTKTSILAKAEEVKKQMMNKLSVQKISEKIESVSDSSNFSQKSEEKSNSPVKSSLNFTQRLNEHVIPIECMSIFIFRFNMFLIFLSIVEGKRNVSI